MFYKNWFKVIIRLNAKSIKAYYFSNGLSIALFFVRHILLLYKSKHKWLIDVFKMILKEIRFAVILHNVGIILSIFNE